MCICGVCVCMSLYFCVGVSVCMCWKIGVAGIFTEKPSLWFLAALGDPCGHLAFPLCTFDFRRICWEKNILSALTSNFLSLEGFACPLMKGISCLWLDASEGFAQLEVHFSNYKSELGRIFYLIDEGVRVCDREGLPCFRLLGEKHTFKTK